MRYLMLLFFALPIGFAGAAFVDIDNTHPHYHAIESLQKTGVVEGYYEDGQRYFYPLRAINRAEALKILMLSAKAKILENDPQEFPDVPFSAWFSPYINSAATQGIVKGFKDGRFHPESQVTRAEFLKMVTKVFGFPEPEKTNDDAWFTPFIELGSDFRLISKSGMDSPHESLNRGEVAEIIFRAQWVKNHNFETRYRYAGTGKASYYNEGFAGRKTASGEIYDPMDLTAAHRTLPFGTRLRVWTDGGKEVFVRINDRGPYHPSRILDLSEKAFTKLAPVTQGVVDVYFEVVAEPSDRRVAIPASIRSSLAIETKNKLVPTEIVDNLTKSQPLKIPPKIVDQVTTHPEDFERKIEIPKKIKPQPLFKTGVNSLSANFFDNVTLRRSIPQKIVVGSVINLAGRVNKDGKEKATFFLQNTKTKAQVLFSGPVSDRNFSIPVFFLETGNYQLGLVFDTQRKSKIASIEVVPYPDGPRWFPAARITTLVKTFEVSVQPEKETVAFRWESDKKRLTKFVFSQGSLTKELYVEDGLMAIEVPYDFFMGFETDENLAIDIFQAESFDGTLLKQQTNWKKGPFKNFELAFGFPDMDKEKVGVPHFTRFKHELTPVTVEGTIFEKNIKLAENMFIIRPDGEVQIFPLTQNGDQFRTRFVPQNWGPHIVEIVSMEGEILFNRAVYFSPKSILPIFPWKQTFVKSDSRGATLQWINKLRQRQRKNKLISSAELDAFAQNYAESMATQGFIGHTDSQGNDFATRARLANIDEVELGENLSYGSNFPLALVGLENSASHRKNILEKKWKRVGIGIARNKKGDYYVSQVFGR